MEPEEHYTMTDGDGKYLHYFTKPGKVEEKVECDSDMYEDIPGIFSVGEGETSVVQSDLDKKPSEIVSIQLMERIKNHDVYKTLNVLGGDSTSSNTWWGGGVMALLEKKLGRKYH